MYMHTYIQALFGEHTIIYKDSNLIGHLHIHTLYMGIMTQTFAKFYGIIECRSIVGYIILTNTTILWLCC